MTYIVDQGCLFLLLCFVGQIISICQGPHPNQCNYDENNSTTETEDDFEKIVCECQKVTFCFVIEFSQECNLTTIKLEVEANTIFSNQFHCNILSLEAQTRVPVFEFLPQTSNEVSLKIFSDSDYGRYKVVCNISENFDEFNSTTKSKWEIVNVNPTSVLVDSEVELQLTVNMQARISSCVTWCFVKTPDNNIEVLLTSWVSSIHVNCLGFNPSVPGVFTISLNSEMAPSIFEKAISVKVLSKHPVAQKAKYNFNFDTIFIYFDENIELHSTCANVFSRQTQKYLGVGFKCFIRGNSLIVKMGSEFKLIDDIAINPENKICRAGSQGAEFCFSSPPYSLPISKPKILGKNLNWYINSDCRENSTQKYMSFKISPKLQENLAIQNQALPISTSGKTQRNNLIMWRLLRQFQNKLFTRQVTLNMSGTEVFSLLENVPSLESILDFDIDDVGSAVKVTITVQSSSASSIMAEAEVTFCKGSTKLFRYKWFVNKTDVFEDGKVVIVKNLYPGKYIIKCMIVAYNSTEILGEGWTTTEVLAIEERVFIIPSEVTVGIAEDILLHAVTPHDSAISWTCRTSFDEPCFTTNQKLVSDLFDLNALNISIPGGTLPVGYYIWTAESIRGLNKAKVFINPGNVSAISVKLPSVFVKPSEEIVLLGSVKKVKRDCRAWWSSIRQRGFSYFKLPTVDNQKNLIEVRYPEDEAPLVIFSSGNLNDLEFDSFYMFKFQVFCPQSSKNEKGSLAYVTVPLIMRNPPQVSALTVEPLEGKAMITDFVISGAVTVTANENYLLVFEWSYVDSCDVVIPIKRGAFSRNFTTYLPPGDIKVIAKVCDEKEICTVTSGPTISVIQPFEFPAENFRNAGNQIQYLMASNDILEAFGLIVTVFKSLVLLSEPEVREEIFLIVEETIKIKINDLTRKMFLDPKATNSSLDFFERAIKVAKYFRKDSEIIDLLMEFKSNILKV